MPQPTANERKPGAETWPKLDKQRLIEWLTEVLESCTSVDSRIVVQELTPESSSLTIEFLNLPLPIGKLYSVIEIPATD